MNALHTSTVPKIPRTSARFRVLRRSPMASSFLTLAVLLVVWETLGRLSPMFASYPSAILTAFADIAFVDQSLMGAILTTLHGTVVGFILAAVLGVGIGFAMGRIPVVAGLLEPYVNAIYATPRIALIPLLVLWSGIGFEMRVVVAILCGIFPIILNTYLGASSVDRGLLDAGRSFNSSELQLLRGVVLPASLPFVMTGLRIGGFQTLVGIIVAEMTSSITGVGQLLITYGRYMQLSHLLAVIITLGFIGVLFMYLMDIAERKAMPWTRQQRA